MTKNAHISYWYYRKYIPEHFYDIFTRQPFTYDSVERLLTKTVFRGRVFRFQILIYDQ